MAIKAPATAHPRTAGRASARRRLAARAGLLALCALGFTTDADAASNKVRISSLSDVTFGTLSDLSSDAAQSQSLCLYSDTATNGYNVTATGGGPGGSFQLTSGLSSLAYEVQWSNASGRNSGVQLSPNVPLTGQTSAASHQVCSNGPATSASLIVLLRSASLSSVTAGTYSGTLTLLVGAE